MSGEGRPHLPALDGVRGVALLAVVTFHAHGVVPDFSANVSRRLGEVIDYGLWGVDLFFVLSGFLITRILIDSRQSPRYFSSFYMRRTLRIFPLYYAYLFFLFVVLRPRWDLSAVVNPLWYFSYLQNWKPGYGSYDPRLQHLWSLAVEEQFYLVWPLLVWLTPPRWVGRACLAGACVGPLSRAALAAWVGDAEAVHRLTPAQLDTLLLGAWLAVAERDPAASAAVRRWWPLVGAGSLLVVAALHGADATVGPAWAMAARRSAFAVLFAGWVGSVAFGGSAWLSAGWLRAVGRYSYAGYIVHSDVIMKAAPLSTRFIMAASPSARPAAWCVCLLAVVAVTMATALASWTLFERHFLALKRYFRY